MAWTSAFESRIEHSSVTAVLLLGDVVGIAAFVLLGEISHGYSPAVYPERVLKTLATFLIGWALAALVGSLYTEEAIDSWRRVVSWTLPAWVVAVVVAQALRATAFFPGDASLTFALVSIGVGGGLVVGWRVLASRLLSR